MKKILLLLVTICFAANVAAQTRPFEMSDEVSASTIWYKVKIENKFLKADGPDGDVIVATDGYGDEYLWAFVTVKDEKFHIVNKALGPTFQLCHSSHQISETSILAMDDYLKMARRKGNTFYWKMTKSGVSGIYTKSLFNYYISTRGGRYNYPTYCSEADSYTEFIRIGNEDEVKAYAESAAKAAAEESEDARLARQQAEEAAEKTDMANLKKHMTGRWKCIDERGHVTPYIFSANGMMEVVTHRHEAMQRKTLDFDIHLIGTFEVLDSHTIAYYQDEKKSYAKNANSIGLSVRDLYELETLRVGEYETLPSTYSFYRIGPASMRCITDGGAELTFVRE